MSTTDILLLICGVMVAYFLGSIPTSVWVGKLFFGKDVRHYGSGNAGATNTMRTLGWKAGLFVLIFDIFKGWLSVFLSSFFTPDYFSTSQVVNYEVLCAVFAVIGHVYPVFANFKGGKGVATLSGILIALLPWETAAAFVVFVVVMFSFRYVSLSSIVTSFCLPFIVIFLPGIFPSMGPPTSFEVLFSILIAIFVPVVHLKNIKRLLKGEEKKMFSKKNKANPPKQAT